jgi:hypothetical protein
MTGIGQMPRSPGTSQALSSSGVSLVSPPLSFTSSRLTDRGTRPRSGGEWAQGRVIGGGIDPFRLPCVRSLRAVTQVTDARILINATSFRKSHGL